jgi:hypothetical protein
MAELLHDREQVAARAAAHGTQLNASVAPVPVHAPEGQPAQLAQVSPGHCASAVHQHAVPAALQAPVEDATSLQLPTAHEYFVAQRGMPGLPSWQCMPS